jgi:hypothetical protein
MGDCMAKRGLHKRTRHSKLAEQLAPVLAYMSRPEGAEEPLQTNWQVDDASASVNPEDIEGLRLDRLLEIVPSIKAIMESVDTGDIERNAAGQTVRIGLLHFSDGTQTERAYAFGVDGKVILCDMRMPVGAMLDSKEKADTQAGGKGSTEKYIRLSNSFFAATLRTPPARYIRGRRDRRKGKSYTADESRAMLADAVANTPTMPATTVYAAGLPCGSPRVAESFLGMQKGRKGESGSIAWQDVSYHIVNREIWDETIASLKAKDIATLDAVTNASTMADVGVTVGQSRDYADKRSGGRRVLVAANDNLRDAMQKAAA